MENEDIDAVVVTLPRQLTYGVVRDCLLAGKHVFTEKPLALNINNAEELRDLSSKNKLLLQVGYMKRFIFLKSTSLCLRHMPRAVNNFHLSKVFF